MSLRAGFVTVLGALLVTGLLVPSEANAEVVVRVNGSVRVSGSVGVRVSPRVRVRPWRVWRRPVVVVAPPPPVVYSTGHTCDCTETTPAPVAAPAPAEPVVVVREARRAPRFALGVRASQLQVGGDEGPEAEGMGLLARIRARNGMELELEVGEDEFKGDNRTDGRLGVALYLPLLRSSLSPYLLVGAGVNAVTRPEFREPATQAYLSAGGGLSLKLGRHLSVGADVRWSARHAADEDEDRLVHRPPIDDEERAFEGRVTGLFWF